jgi:hypothetical protein
MTCPHCQRLLRVEIREIKFTSCPYCHEELDNEVRAEDASATIEEYSSLLNQSKLERKAKRARELAEALPVAQWMEAEFRRTGLLFQREAAESILARFGEQFTYRNDNGNLAIIEAVLVQFRKLTSNEAIWEKSYFHWRRRRAGDPAGRMVS